jgi:hypothetical protein
MSFYSKNQKDIEENDKCKLVFRAHELHLGTRIELEELNLMVSFSNFLANYYSVVDNPSL